MEEQMYRKLILLGALALAWPAGRLNAEAVAKVGGESISREEFEAKARFEESNLKRALTKPERLGLLKSVVNQRLLVAEAKRQKLDREPAFKAFVAETERKALADRIYEAEVSSKSQVTPEAARQFYAQHPEAFDVAQVSQIFIATAAGKEAETEKKVADIKARVSKAPKTFAAVAKAESDDPESKVRGGDLGAVRRGVLVADLEKSVFSAKAPAILGPLRSQYGYHILQVRSVKHLSWDDVAATLPQELQRAQATQLQTLLIEKLAKQDKITLYEDKL
jgi:parvulin-like peptidyl-prolyl isomerase